MKSEDKLTVGWREFVSLPALGITDIKAKIDTGARTSCLHAFKTEHFTKEDTPWLRFWIHPVQHDQEQVVECEAPILDTRRVRDSGGHEELRDVIRTELKLADKSWPIEITITNRENMRFRMLLGRTAMHQRVLVDPGLSFLTSRRTEADR